MMSRTPLLLPMLAALNCSLLFPCPSAAADDRPNVLLIVADDMGYSDLGSFGSEIATPHLDAMAMKGLRFTNMHAAPSCSPTRAMLMSGCDNHTAGLGAMNEQINDEQKDQPGYETHLNDRVAALPELLQDADYHTYMAGKWHLGLTEELSPAARGFDKSFALLIGGGSHFDMSGTDDETEESPYRENGKKVDSLPDDFYSTEYYADKLMEYIEDGRDDGKPFFGWLAFTAPHWPLHAPDDFIDKYAGRYDSGFDALRIQRMARMKSMGITSANYDEDSFHRVGQLWEQLPQDQQTDLARKMEIYSAMVECMDFHVGRVLSYLKETGQLDNTVVIFMSDNGADGGDVDRPGSPFSDFITEKCDNTPANMGRAGSFISKGRNWAQACTAPYKMWKGFTTEGGIRVPAFMYHPKMQRGGNVDRQLLSAMDIAPTVLELAQADQPGTEYKGRKVEPIQGKSFAGLLNSDGRVHAADEAIGWELHGRRSLFMDDWKAVHYGRPHGTNNWELYDLKNDPSESRNLAQSRPDVLQAMSKAWDQYASDKGVILVADVPPGAAAGGRGGQQGGAGGQGRGSGQQGGAGGQGRGAGGQGRGIGQQGGPGGQGMGAAGGQRGMGGQRQPLVGALDKNGDLEITDDELKLASRSILSLDANGDGQLTSEEYRRATDGNQTGPQTPGQAGRPVATPAPATPRAASQIFYVKAGASGGNGSSWETAISSLTTALQQARPGDEIRVAQGTYLPSATNDRSVSFQLAAGVTVLGGYSGQGDERNWEQFSTVLSGDLGEPGNDLDNSYHIVIGAADAVLDGFTVSGGNGTNARRGGGGQRGGGQRGGGQRGQGQGPPRQGGGQRGPAMQSSAAPVAPAPILVSMPQQGQRGPGGGGRGPGGPGQGPGGPGGPGGPPEQGGGGAPAPIHITPQMIISGINPGAGAGIVNFQCAPTYRNCIIRDNQSRKGAAVYNMVATTTPADPEFKIEPAPKFINCSFINNYAIGRGGAISNDLGTQPTFIQCTFTDNRCDGKGGAIYNDFRCSPTLIYCLFTGNTAFDGGALGNDGSSSPIITNCTFTGNHAIDMGAALYQGSGPSNNPIVTNTIIWGNKCDNGPAGIVNWHDNSPVVTYSCIEGGYPGHGNIDTDPQFVDPENGDYSLAAGSLCIDAANGLAAPLTDRLDHPRHDDTGVVNGPVASIVSAMGDLGRTAREGTAPADIGAFERLESTVFERLKTVFVNTTNTGQQDGRSWNTAFTTLQPAIELAYRSRAEVWVAAGTYTPTTTEDREVSIELRDGVALYGGFRGNEASRDQLTADPATTILSGDIGQPNVAKDNSYHVLVGATEASLNGFTITGGHANGQAFHAKGGGMINYARHIQKAPTGWATGLTVHLTNCVFQNNTAIEGGGIYNYDRSEPTFRNVTFRNNSAESGGAMVDRVGVISRLKGCTFSGNYAKWRGGAVYFDYGSRPVIEDCTFTNNSTDGHGGATYIISRASQLENTVVSINDCTFDANTARLRGGGIANADSGILEVKNARMTNNKAGRGGGAISNEYLSTATISGLQLSGNRSEQGAADVDTDETSNATITP